MHVDLFLISSYRRAGKLDGRVSSLKIKKQRNQTIEIAVIGQSTPDERLYSFKMTGKKNSSAREYDSPHVRYWNRFVTTEQNSIWYLRLQEIASNEFECSTRYKFFPDSLMNVLKNSRLQSPTLKETDSSGDFDLSCNGTTPLRSTLS